MWSVTLGSIKWPEIPRFEVIDAAGEFYIAVSWIDVVTLVFKKRKRLILFKIHMQPNIRYHL